MGGIVSGGFAGGQGAAGRGGPGGAARTTAAVTGPVVATGGAPAALEFNSQRATKAMREYPAGVQRFDEYTTPYGLANTDLLSPPWSSITAYDLNTGKIKWKKPLGQDVRIPLMPGQENMGVPEGSQRKSMIVTSTGIVFATSKGGFLYAYDAENGNLLWTYTLPKDTDGLLTTYLVKGKQYIVVLGTRNYTNQSIDHSKDMGALPQGYIVLSIPNKKK